MIADRSRDMRGDGSLASPHFVCGFLLFFCILMGREQMKEEVFAVLVGISYVYLRHAVVMRRLGDFQVVGL
jgi:hypothetical protein